MKTSEEIIQKHSKAKGFIEKNIEKDLTIFIIDENKKYLNLLKNSLKRENFLIYDFPNGEMCLDYLELNPDLVILDEHIDKMETRSRKSIELSKLISQKVPEAEVSVIDSNKKTEFISDVHSVQEQSFNESKMLIKLKNLVNSFIDK